MMKKRSFNIFTLLVLAWCFGACKTHDIQVTPVGGSVPYSGSNATVRQVLDSLGGANLKVFKAMWLKTNMDSLLKAQPQAAYTVLAPTDSAFQVAGITPDMVNLMPVEELDTIVYYHTLTNWVGMAQMKAGLPGNQAMSSFLNRNNFFNYTYSSFNYFQCLGIHEGKLMVNGQPHAFAGVDGINGTVYLLDQVLKKPETQMIDYLQNNPNFTFLMEALRLNDSITGGSYGSASFTSLLSAGPDVPITFFAPTNNAFHKAGFLTFDDLRVRAVKGAENYNPYGYYRPPENYYVVDHTSLDSMLMVNRFDVGADMRPSYRELYFTNDFTDNPNLGGTIIQGGSAYQSPPQVIRLKFSTSGGKIMAQQIGSGLAPIPLSDSVNMVFVNGIMHIVDADLFTH